MWLRDFHATRPIDWTTWLHVIDQIWAPLFFSWSSSIQSIGFSMNSDPVRSNGRWSNLFTIGWKHITEDLIYWYRFDVTPHSGMWVLRNSTRYLRDKRELLSDRIPKFISLYRLFLDHEKDWSIDSDFSNKVP
jgi:hypothetical protein